MLPVESFAFVGALCTSGLGHRIPRAHMVLFPDFNKSARLPTGETVSIEFTPEKSEEYGFQCQMGMLRSKLIVED